jgi:hypothetical protein
MGRTLLFTCLDNAETVTDRYCDTGAVRTSFSCRMSWYGCGQSKRRNPMKVVVLSMALTPAAAG